MTISDDLHPTCPMQWCCFDLVQLSTPSLLNLSSSHVDDSLHYHRYLLHLASFHVHCCSWNGKLQMLRLNFLSADHYSMASSEVDGNSGNCGILDDVEEIKGA